MLPEDRPHTRSLPTEEGASLQQFPSEAQGRITTSQPATVAPLSPSSRSTEPVDTPRIVLLKPKNDLVLNEPLRQFPTEAPERAHVPRTEIQSPPRQAARADRFNEAARSSAKAELRSIARPRVVAADVKRARPRPRSMKWAAALILAVPAVVALIVVARPVARLRDLAQTARMAEPAQASGGLVAFPIAIQLSPDVQPAVPPHIPLTSGLAAPIRTTASAPTPPPIAPQTAAPASVRASSIESASTGSASTGSASIGSPSMAPSAFRGSLSVTSTPEGARVLVNGIFVGTTPLTLDAPVGSRAIRVELDGYERWSSLVRIVANEPTAVTVDLKPSPIQ